MKKSQLQAVYINLDINLHYLKEIMNPIFKFETM